MEKVLRFLGSGQALLTDFNKLIATQESLRVQMHKFSVLGKGQEKIATKELLTKADAEMDALKGVCQELFNMPIGELQERIISLNAGLDEYYNTKQEQAKTKLAMAVLEKVSGEQNEDSIQEIKLQLEELDQNLEYMWNEIESMASKPLITTL